MKTLKFLTLILTLMLTISLFFACGEDEPESIPKTDEELIEARIEEFVNAYNTGDTEKLLASLDAKSRNTLNAMLGLVGGITDSAIGFNVDLTQLFSLGVGLYEGDFMKLKIGDITVVDSKNAYAKATMTLAESETMPIYFVMLYENDGWYVNDMTDNTSKLPTGSSDGSGTEDNSNGENTETVKYNLTTTSYTDDYGKAGTYTKYDKKAVSAGEEVTLTAVANSGYNFEGWYYNEGWSSTLMSENPVYTFKMGSKNAVYYAVFSYYTVNTYSFGDEYGVAGEYTEISDKKVSEGELVSLSATVKDGYNFEGWYRDDVCLTEELDYSFTMGKEDIGLEARYSRYTVNTFSWSDEEGTAGNFTVMQDELISAGETVVLTATVNKGYNFEGWYKNDVCLTTELEYSFVMGKEDVGFEARYSRYTVNTFSWSDEEGTAGNFTVMQDELISAGETVVLTATVNKGYNFEGWYKNDVCLTTELEYSFVMGKEDVGFEARYSRYTVNTFSWSDEEGTAGNFTVMQDELISAGETVVLTATVNKGYNFEGWYKNGVCLTEELEYSFVMGKENAVFEAKYTCFCISTGSWTDDNGVAGSYTKYDNEKISVGEVITLTATVRAGYRFLGWYINDATLYSSSLKCTYVMKDADVYFCAEYEKIE